MKPNPTFVAVALLLFVVAVAGAMFLLSKSTSPFSKTPPPEAPLPSQTPPVSGEAVEPGFLEGTFSRAGNQEDVEISLQGARDGKSVMVSWDESQMRVFHVVLLTPDFQALWFLSPFESLPQDVQIQDVSSFISSGYVLGDRIEGFQSFDEPEKLELVLGQEYYLQVLGFTKDNQNIGVNKIFTFSASCAPPNCQ